MRYRQVKEAGFPKRKWRSGDLSPCPSPALLCDSHYNGGEGSIEDTKNAPSLRLINCCKEFVLCLKMSLFAFSSLLDSEAFSLIFGVPWSPESKLALLFPGKKLCGALPTPFSLLCQLSASLPRSSRIIFLNNVGL